MGCGGHRPRAGRGPEGLCSHPHSVVRRVRLADRYDLGPREATVRDGDRRIRLGGGISALSRCDAARSPRVHRQSTTPHRDAPGFGHRTPRRAGHQRDGGRIRVVLVQPRRGCRLGCTRRSSPAAGASDPWDARAWLGCHLAFGASSRKHADRGRCVGPAGAARHESGAVGAIRHLGPAARSAALRMGPVAADRRHRPDSAPLPVVVQRPCRAGAATRGRARCPQWPHARRVDRHAHQARWGRLCA